MITLKAHFQTIRSSSAVSTILMQWLNHPFCLVLNEPLCKLPKIEYID